MRQKMDYLHGKMQHSFNIKEVSYIHVSVKTTRDWLTGGARLVVYVVPFSRKRAGIQKSFKRSP